MNLRLIGQQLRQQRVKFAYGMGVVKAEHFARLPRPVAKTVPDFAFAVLHATEQYALRLIAGDQHQHGLGLGEARQVIEIAVVAIRIMRVAIARAFGRRRNEGDAALHALREPRAPRSVHLVSTNS